MSSVQVDGSVSPRYGIVLAAIVLAAFVVSSLFGIDLVAIAWPLAGGISIALAVVFVILFYRLVVAVEKIAERL